MKVVLYLIIHVRFSKGKKCAGCSGTILNEVALQLTLSINDMRFIQSLDNHHLQIAACQRTYLVWEILSITIFVRHPTHNVNIGQSSLGIKMVYFLCCTNANTFIFPNLYDWNVILSLDDHFTYNLQLPNVDLRNFKGNKKACNRRRES